MRYWKKYDNKFYNFEDAYALWQKLWKENKFPAIPLVPNVPKFVVC